MTDLIQQEKIFVQDDVATRLSKIANNLSAIKREVTFNPSAAASLIRESLFFIEWTAPTLIEVDVEQAQELVDVGRTLARWQYRWDKICQDSEALSDVAIEAGNLSEHHIFS
ncbi:unknown protein [Rivularia sp. IAM M-261]|nr:unknown protein [Calothrix sp. PCC 7716]GJD15987.1 unknown protein [Rivularia sp. IAM M-261]